MNKLIIILSLFAVLSGCSKSAKPRTFKLTLGAVVGAIEIAGGALLKLVNTSTGEVIVMELSTPPYTAIIPNGAWSMYLVGFSGPSLWQGSTYCGETAKTLAGTDVEIIIDATSSTCANIPYTQLIATKVTAWDSSLWDEGKWGP